MKAAVLYELKTPLKVEDVDLDNPKAGEVRVKIVANGVCHSDYSVIHGVLPHRRRVFLARRPSRDRRMGRRDRAWTCRGSSTCTGKRNSNSTS